MPGLERTFVQSDFDRFAALSGDDNPIHVDADFSARTGFGRTVAHGALLVSILHSLAVRLRPGARLLRQEIRFPAPTYAGEPMAFETELESDGPDGARFTCRAVRLADGVVTCDGVLVLEPAP